MWRRSGSALSQRLALSEEVAEALYGRQEARGGARVHHHLARHAVPAEPADGAARGGDRACARGVSGHDLHRRGALKVGLGEKDLAQLAELGAGAKKCSTRDIAATVTDKKVVGATTVSSTM